jgi:hypothetical protein
MLPVWDAYSSVASHLNWDLFVSGSEEEHWISG